MKRSISILLALALASGLTACGGAASSSAVSESAAAGAASSEAAASSSESTASSSEAAAEAKTAVTNYFEENGIEVQPLPDGQVPMDFVTWLADDPSVYTVWDTGTVNVFSAISTPAEDREGYQKVTLQLQAVMRLKEDASLDGEWRVSWKNGVYDLYTGRHFPSKSTQENVVDGFEYETTVTYDGQEYPVYYSKNSNWSYSGWNENPMTHEQENNAICQQTYTFLVPDGYDGIVYGVFPATTPSEEITGDEEINESEIYALDDMEGMETDKVTFFRVNQEP